MQPEDFPSACPEKNSRKALPADRSGSIDNLDNYALMELFARMDLPELLSMRTTCSRMREYVDSELERRAGRSPACAYAVKRIAMCRSWWESEKTERYIQMRLADLEQERIQENFLEFISQPQKHNNSDDVNDDDIEFYLTRSSDVDNVDGNSEDTDESTVYDDDDSLSSLHVKP
jgi:hypothetical protein